MVDIVVEQASAKHYNSSGLFSPQGAEKDYRNNIGP